MQFQLRREKFLEQWSGEPFVLQGVGRPIDAIPWRQDRDFLYLTGVDEPNAALEYKDGEWILHLEERSAWDALWHGERLSFEEMSEVSEIDTIECHSGVRRSRTIARRSRVRLRRKSSTNVADDIRALIHRLRLIKDADEIAALKKANGISLAMFSDIEEFIRPGVGEAEIEGELFRLMKNHGGTEWAYPPIVASGVNATTLHYTKNNRTIEEGDLVLIDAGAEYAHYASDVTRTFCAGSMSGEQKAIYDLVASAQRAAVQAASPGATLADIDAAARRVLRAGLKELRVLFDASDELGAEKIFFPHRTSHWIGLDVHDPCPMETPLVQGGIGMAFTVEPGLYFRITQDPLDIFRGRLKEKELSQLQKSLGAGERFKGIGVRIEDDLIIQ